MIPKVITPLDKQCYDYYISNIGLDNPITIKNRLVQRINLNVKGQSRYAILVHPKNGNQDALIFYHGSRSIAWESLWITTSFLDTFDGTIIFGQAHGTIIEPYIHPKFGDVSYGELYFEIRDEDPQFQIDLEYTKLLVELLNGKKNIYFVGHSNGGIFGLLLALHTAPGTFMGIVSHMGGIGWDPHYYLNFSLIEKYSTESLPKIFIYTGEFDEYRAPSEQARDIFMGYDFPQVDFYLEPDAYHEYHSEIVDPILIKWFEQITH